MGRGLLVGGITFLILQVLVASQYVLANQDKFLTVGQMKSRGIARGLPLVHHYGIVGDLFYLSFVISIIVGMYFATWSWSAIGIALGIAAVIGVILGGIWLLPDTPEAHMMNHRPTVVGVVHGIYMVPVIMVLLLLYFFTPQPNPTLLLVVSVVLVMHLFVGQHMLLGVLKWMSPADYFWYPDRPLRNWLGWFFLAALAGALWWRVGKLIG